MKFKKFLLAASAATALAAAVSAAQAEDIKIGLILPMTGQQQSTGKQEAAGAKLYMQQNGDTVAGKKIELIIKDDGAVPDNSKRIAQDLIVNDKVNFLVGFGVTPAALAVAPLATEGKTPEIVTAAGTSIITEKSPYITRTSFTLAQSTVPMADWAAQNGIKKVVSMVSDYAPGADAAKSFAAEFTAKGGQILDSITFPLANPDFAPFLQRAADQKPDAIFVFVPSGQGGIFVKQFAERGMDKAGIKIIGPGDVTDDDLINGMGDPVVGTITAHIYSADHDSATNKAFVDAFKKANGGMRPNFMAVGGYDGMHLIYEALKKTGGKTDGDSLLAAMKGMSWESPRGPISIDPETRDIVQNVYIRKVEKKNGELYNVEFATFPSVKDPIKAAEKK
ncbi:MAG TPA: ABC transporter substrate-binding protein [Xanthobacteraceae bacterium]|jgi:branched-chain amino acid transport system substrate-binding protein|nr:ABC transporter substrate-binding protein [Xanthobacteraceae bacterium]